MSMRGNSTTTQSDTAPASAADDSSSAARSLPAASVAAGACGIAPHAQSNLELWVSNSDSPELSPAVPRSSKDLPN